MGFVSFMRRWFVGTRGYARSPLGVVHTQLIITFFIVFGLFLGAWDQRLRGNGLVGFVLFGFGCLQIFTFKQLWKQYGLLVKEDKMLRKTKGGYE